MESGDQQYESAASQAGGTIGGIVTHPLQDIDLSADADGDDISSEMQHQQSGERRSTAAARSKQNWVKFDDDVNGVEVNEKHHNENNKTLDQIDSAIDSSTAVAAAATAATATAVGVAIAKPPTTTATANRLSPIPPPASMHVSSSSPNTSNNSSSSARARPRTSSESGSQQTALAAPVQRPVVSSTSPSTSADVAPAVLTTESTHVNLNASGRTQHHQQQQQQQPHQQHAHQNQKLKPPSHATHHGPSNGGAGGGVGVGVGAGKPTSVAVPIETAPPMRTIELSTGRVREGFANGDVIVTLLPANTKWPWITPAIFRPELVPEELMAQGLTLTVEEYVAAMETLVNDYRFTVYNICYKRILVCWIFFAFSVLLTLLFSGLQGVALFSLGVGWLFLNTVAIFLCMWVKLRLSRGLEKCLARVNKQLMRHKILLVLDDRGRISCHKVNLCFLYFDAAPCVSYLNEFLEQTEQQHGPDVIKAGWESRLDIDLNDIIIQGSTPVRVSRKQAVAQELFLSYLQRWGKDFLRRRLDWTVQEAGVHEQPRHLQSSICPCQYEEEVLRNKIKLHLQQRKCCGLSCHGCWI